MTYCYSHSVGPLYGGWKGGSLFSTDSRKIVTRIMKSNSHDKLFHLKEYNCNNIRRCLRELRVKRDPSTTEMDSLDSSIGAVHSNCIRKIQVTAKECGEHLKVANILSVNKLKQNLKSTLEALTAQNDCLICSINTNINDAECLVPSMTQEIICKQFTAFMHILSNTNTQKLTLNTSSYINSKEKIDTINFAMHCVSTTESECKDTEIRSSELNALKYITEINKLSSLEDLIKIYQPTNVHTHTFTPADDISGQRQIHAFPTKHRISQGQQFFQYSVDIAEEMDGMTERCVLCPESLLQVDKSSEQFHGLLFPKRTRLAAAGTFDQKSNHTMRPHSNNFRDFSSTRNQCLLRQSDTMTAASAEERTVGRNAFSSDSLAAIQETQNLFSDKFTGRSREMTRPCAFEPGTTNKFSQTPTPLSNHPRIAEHSQTSIGAGINSLSPSTETINRNLHSVESITDIANIPKQFYCKKYFTPNLNHYRGGGRAIYNLTERIRQAKEKFYCSGGLQTMNHYASQKQNFTDIGDITNPFSMNYYEKNPSGASRSGPYRTESLADMKAIPDPFSPKGLSTGQQYFGNVDITKKTANTQEYITQPYARYTPSEIEDINAYPEFVREDQAIGKKALTREECEELRGISPITDKEQRKSPIINRYELSDDELNDLKNLPDIVDSQYAIGRGIRSEEEIQEIQALPDIHSYSPVSDWKLLTKSNRSTSGLANSGLQSAYVAPDMRSHHFDSPVSSEYIMHRQ
ncbi:Uncharacterized protein BM_BM10259 [Brugia malayi]|uniref:Bm10259, isoform a; Bm10259, isoform a; Bm10259, isoform b n=2 Tax=Brugia malayi TaxID=6279 RepID=A0A4E9F7L5_BRUMA|nr:Uncharacterized protein BM_BM10259 [Brugia malayi]VIO92826.1 Uncharacterized protein BM_BM10259 [Brugia malayi]